MTDIPPTDEDLAAEALIEYLNEFTDRKCPGCSHSPCGHELLFSSAMGVKDAPRCLSCLADLFQRDRDELRGHLAAYVRRRDCYWRAWQEANRREGHTGTDLPVCLGTPQPTEPKEWSDSETEAKSDTGWTVTEIWDAGEMSCGDLVLALRIRMNKLNPGEVLQITALDPAAPEDLPAWCRMTGHRLLRVDHPKYDIQRKEP